MEQRLACKGDVYERGHIGGSKRVSKNIAYNPCMLACEVGKREGLLLTREFSDVSCWLRQRIEHRVRVG